MIKMKFHLLFQKMNQNFHLKNLCNITKMLKRLKISFNSIKMLKKSFKNKKKMKNI